MKRDNKLICLTLILALMAFLVAGVAGCQRNTATGVNFLHDWEAAKERASREDKPIMINFYTDV